MTKPFPSIRRHAQGGFTLLELLVVIVFIGILMAIFAPKLMGTTGGAKAAAMTNIAQAMGQNLTLLSQTCGVTSAVASNPLPGAGKTLQDALFSGREAVAPAYQACYDSSHVRPFGSSIQAGKTAGTYAVSGFDMSIADGGLLPLKVVFDAVPDDVTLALAQARDRNVTTLAGSDTASPFLQYSAPGSDGSRTVTMLIQ